MSKVDRTLELKALQKINVPKDKINSTQEKLREELDTFPEEARQTLRGIEASLTVVVSQSDGCSDQKLQELLDLCQARVSTLQNLSEKRRESRNDTKKISKFSWIDGMFGPSSTERLSHIDQHEAAIVAFVNHRMSHLTKCLESERSARIFRFKKSEVIANTRFSVVASRRNHPATSPPSIKLMVPEEPETPVNFAEKYDLDNSQMAMLVSENEGLLQEFQETSRQVEQAAASLNEISRLQTTLQEQLIYQAAQVEHIYDDADEVAVTMLKANQHLVSASGRQSSSVRFFVCFVLFATLLLLVLHFASD